MGQYVDNMDNLVEGLLEVIPISYLLSPTFEEDIQKSIYRNNWNNCISIPASISKETSDLGTISPRHRIVPQYI